MDQINELLGIKKNVQIIPPLPPVDYTKLEAQIADLSRKIKERKIQKLTRSLSKFPPQYILQPLFLAEALLDLDLLIGHQKLKKAICRGIKKLLVQRHHGEVNTDMMSVVLSGPPGVGKTEIGKILARVFLSLGYLAPHQSPPKKRAPLSSELSLDLGDEKPHGIDRIYKYLPYLVAFTTILIAVNNAWTEILRTINRFGRTKATIVLLCVIAFIGYCMFSSWRSFKRSTPGFNVHLTKNKLKMNYQPKDSAQSRDVSVTNPKELING